MSSLSIIASPLQLINVIEAINEFKLKNNDLLILKTTNDINNKQIDRLLYNQKDMKFRNIFIINYNSKIYEGILFVIKTIFILKNFKAKKYNFLFLGNYRSLQMRHLSNIFFYKNLYLVDDGNATIGLDKFKIQKNLKYYIYKLFGYRLVLKKYSLFSMYKQELFAKNSYEMYRYNSFEVTKKYIFEKKELNKVYFIGQHLIELKIVDYSYYYKYLSCIIDFYKTEDLEFVYILHRANDYDLIKQLSLDLNFNIIQFDYPIEIELMNATEIPKQFATFYSTGAMVIKKLLPDSVVTAFYIDSLNLSNDFRKVLNLDNYYENMQDENIIIRKLKNCMSIDSLKELTK